MPAKAACFKKYHSAEPTTPEICSVDGSEPIRLELLKDTSAHGRWMYKLDANVKRVPIAKKTLGDDGQPSWAFTGFQLVYWLVQTNLNDTDMYQPYRRVIESWLLFYP